MDAKGARRAMQRVEYILDVICGFVVYVVVKGDATEASIENCDGIEKLYKA
jgi:hypothetical protein